MRRQNQIEMPLGAIIRQIRDISHGEPPEWSG